MNYEKIDSNIVYLFAIIICVLVILIILKSIGGKYVVVKSKRIDGVINNYETVNFGSKKHIVAYTMNSCGACPSQKLTVKYTPPSLAGPDYLTSVGTSYYKLNIPPNSVSNTMDAVVNEIQFFSKRKVPEPMLTVDVLKTNKFLDYWVDGKAAYGPTFNPDTYVLSSVYGYKIPQTFTDGLPPVLQLSYLEGMCAATGLSIRNMWNGYVVDIDHGRKFSGVSSYDLTIQGPKNVPLTYYQSYLYSHSNPTISKPHFHFTPRLSNSQIQEDLDPTGPGTSTPYDLWNLKITRSVGVSSGTSAPNHRRRPSTPDTLDGDSDDEPAENPTGPAAEDTTEEAAGDLADEAAGESAGAEAGEIVGEVLAAALCSIS